MREKLDFVSILDRKTNLIDIVTKQPITVRVLLSKLPKELTELATNAESRLSFTRQLDKLYDSGQRELGTAWSDLKLYGELSENEAFDLIRQFKEN